MRVILTDNFGRDNPVEKFITCSLPKQLAEAVAKVLNEREPMTGPDYYAVVENDYVLKDGNPNK